MHKFTSLKRNVADVVTSAVVGARDLAVEAKEGVERALVAKCLRGYSVKEQVATGGPKGVWKIYNAEARNQGAQYPRVSVWLLEKKLLQDSHKGVKAKVWDEFLDQQRKNATNMLKLKHPGILKLLEAMEETRTQFIMITEPVVGSLDNFLHSFNGVPNVPKEIQNIDMPELEVKHGLLQVADALHFLHTEAKLAHCAVSPDSTFISVDGKWRLSGLGMCMSFDYNGSRKSNAFDYTESHPLYWDALSKPQLGYVAPELASGYGQDMHTNVTPACDIFSLGLLAYGALTKQQLLVVGDELMEYRNKIASISQIDLSRVSQQFQYSLRMMLSPTPSSRPPASAFSSSPYFQEDKLIRALVFLDTMVQRETVQKAAFLKDLETFWPMLHTRVIRYKVLPQLLQELQNPAMQTLVVPFVFKAVSSQTKEEFKLYTLAKLKTVLMTAKGDGMLAVLKHVDDLSKLMSRALEENNVRVLEEALKTIQSMVDEFDYEPLKGKLIPRVHVICLRTASAKVRVNSLILLGNLAQRMDKDEAEKMLHTCAQVSAVDKTPGTLMCVLGVGDAISKHWGPEITAQKVLPFLCPLLLSSALSHQQFSTYMTLIKEMLKRVEDKRRSQLGDIVGPAVTATSAEQKLQNGWDAGPTPQAPTGFEPQSPSTPPVPVVVTKGLPPSAALDNLFQTSPSNSTPKAVPALNPPPKANNPSAGLGLLDDWPSQSAAPKSDGLSFSTGLMGGVARPPIPTSMNSGTNLGTQVGTSMVQTPQLGRMGNTLQAHNATRMDGNLMGTNSTLGLNYGKVQTADTSFCDPGWKDPPVQSLSGTPLQPGTGIFSSVAPQTQSTNLMFSGLSMGQFTSTSNMGSEMVNLQGQNQYSIVQPPVAMNQLPSISKGPAPLNATPLEPLGIETSMGGKPQSTPQNPTGDPFLDLLS